MGKSETLQHFLSWGIQHFPADHYVLLFWDHGGGPLQGVQFDELHPTVNTPWDSLSLIDLEKIPPLKGAWEELVQQLNQQFMKEPEQFIFLNLLFEGIELTEDGHLSCDFSDAWITLNGHPITLFIDEIDDEMVFYSIPAQLNHQEVNLIACRNRETEQFELIGASPVAEEDGALSGDLLPLQAGDQITPRYYYVDTKTGEEGLIDGESFTLSADSNLTYLQRILTIYSSHINYIHDLNYFSLDFLFNITVYLHI